MDIEDYIGYKNPDGAVMKWPRVDVLGHPYSRPCTTRGIAALAFVVVPRGPKAAVDFAVQEAREYVLYSAVTVEGEPDPDAPMLPVEEPDDEADD